MTESIFRGGLVFLEEVGIYDVVLPFLLVFTLVFALLEKTKVLGVESSTRDSSDKVKYPKRNLNSMVAFVISFFVIASSKLVALINQTVSHVFILLLLSVMFLLVAGSFGKDEEFGLTGSAKNFAMIVMGIAIVIIFLNAMGWIQLLYEFLRDHWSSDGVSAVIFLVIIVIFIIYVTKPKSSSEKKESDDSSD